MVYEIQKNFLLYDCSILNNLKKDGVFLNHYKIEFFYTKITPRYNIKFKNSHNEFYKITKSNNLILEQKQEEKISQKKYEKARKKLLGNAITKECFEFKFCSLNACIEVYKNFEIYILKIFFPTCNAAKNFKIPVEFNVKKELQNNLDLKSIVLYGFEYENFNVEKCFKIIEKNSHFTLDFPNSINSCDGFRVFLFYLFKKIKFHWKLFLENKNHQNFYDFIYYTREIYVILSNINTILDQNISNNLAYKFKNLIDKSQEIINNEGLNENLILFLSDQNIQNLFNDFDFFIKENSFYQGEYKDQFFKQIIALEFRKKMILFRKNILKNFELEILENQFFELSVFLNYFNDFFEIKSLHKLYKKYFKGKNENTIYKKIKNKNKFCKLLKKTSQNLKIYKG